jgi:taurine--2-oxoglutarate transaminase
MADRSLSELNRDYVLFPWVTQATHRPLAITRAEGVYLWDDDGKRYLDFSSQAFCVNAGHSHPRIVRAVQEQIAELAFVSSASATRVKGELAQLLAEVTPGDLGKTLFLVSGAEANEHAIKLARMVTGRSKIIARYRSYHGATAGAATLTGDPRGWPVEPGIPGVVHAFDPYCYRCPFGKEPSSCARECVTHIEEIIQYEGPENVAAIIAEGVTGANGAFIPVDDYWPKLRAICDKHGILLIADEILSGFGRTGRWFAVDHWGVVPDMITMAKGLTSAHLPLGAVTVSKRIADALADRPLVTGTTYSGHPVACAAAKAAIEVYRDEELIENSARLGRVLAGLLADLKARHPSVGDVRNLGLWGVLELIKDRRTNEPMAPFNAKASEMGKMAELTTFLRSQGLYTVVRWNYVFIAPPLVISEEQLRAGLEIINEGLDITDIGVRQ